uniref:Chaperonin-like n=1 Tax=Oryza sativa subsp. japonica TaxID=39947 RepID=Q6ET45_ORYSJ|nr:chaperonin-like [Oryza sativa Japonica Group]BAD28175.1 chaperonin-like [Oryza sativa Japonica Group]
MGPSPAPASPPADPELLRLRRCQSLDLLHPLLQAVVGWPNPLRAWPMGPRLLLFAGAPRTTLVTGLCSTPQLVATVDLRSAGRGPLLRRHGGSGSGNRGTTLPRAATAGQGGGQCRRWPGCGGGWGRVVALSPILRNRGFTVFKLFALSCYFIEEAERSLHGAIIIVSRAVKNPTVVPGGGAMDMEVSKYLRRHARTIVVKSQFFVHSFAKALEPNPMAETASIPRAVAPERLHRHRHQRRRGASHAATSTTGAAAARAPAVGRKDGQELLVKQARSQLASSSSSGLFGTAPALAPPLLELELSQTVSAPPKLGVELGGALSQNTLELWSWV